MSEQIVQLSPDDILADDNVRHNLKKVDLDRLKSSILELGGVHTPLEVEEIEHKKGQPAYRLAKGFYRHRAVSELNAESNAGLSLPAIVRAYETPLVRLRQQISENIDRQNMSPIDEAVAMKKLMDAGVERGEIRRIFSRTTGKKGLQIVPLSNAMLNIFLNFLDLPKTIQEKIHDGRVGVAAAYELGKVAPEKRQAVIERAEADRLAQIEREEKDEAKYLEAEAKLAKAKDEEVGASKAVDEAKAGLSRAEDNLKAKKAELAELKKTPVEQAEGKEFKERLGAANNDVKSAEKLLKDAKTELTEAIEAQKKAESRVSSHAEKIAAARKAVNGAKKKTAVGPVDVKRAAKAEGADAGYVALTLSEIRDAVKDLMGHKTKLVSDMGFVLSQCFNGVTTPKLLAEDIEAAARGEYQRPDRKVKKAAPKAAVAAAAE